MKSLGYVEVRGLSTAIVAADRMLKTADVSLQTVENTKGGGWITVTVTGDVAAVSAAVDSAIELIDDKVVSSVIIANPAEGIDALGKSDAIMQPQAEPKSQSSKSAIVPSEPKPVVKTENVIPAHSTTQSSSAVIDGESTPTEAKSGSSATKKPESASNASRKSTRTKNIGSTTKKTDPKDNDKQ